MTISFFINLNRDLAARNCLVTSDLTVKVGDYGTSIETFKVNCFLNVFLKSIRNCFRALVVKNLTINNFYLSVTG